MQMPTDEDLLAKVEQFLTTNDVAPTRFGREAMGEASLVSRMRAGRSMSLRNANKLIAFMDSYSPTGEAADTATDIDRSSGKIGSASQQVSA